MLDDELIDNWNETSKSKEYRENFNSNEFKNNQVEQEPNRIVNEMTMDLNSKVEKLDKGFFHGLITPFATKEEFGRYLSQEIISLLLNIIMTYAITVGVADAEKMAKVMILSIKNRLKHYPCPSGAFYLPKLVVIKEFNCFCLRITSKQCNARSFGYFLYCIHATLIFN